MCIVSGDIGSFTCLPWFCPGFFWEGARGEGRYYHLIRVSRMLPFCMMLVWLLAVTTAAQQHHAWFKHWLHQMLLDVARRPDAQSSLGLPKLCPHPCIFCIASLTAQ